MYSCPDMTCRAPMIKRQERGTTEVFYRCSRYPDCWMTMPIPERERMIELDAAMLPGFETEGD